MRIFRGKVWVHTPSPMKTLVQMGACHPPFTGGGLKKQDKIGDFVVQGGTGATCLVNSLLHITHRELRNTKNCCEGEGRGHKGPEQPRRWVVDTGAAPKTSAVDKNGGGRAKALVRREKRERLQLGWLKKRL